MKHAEVIDRKVKAFDKYGQFDYTKHENMFAALFPEFDRQVTFGTGKGGLKKWGTKKFTADFYDPINKIVYEIDGRSHKRLIVQLNDRLKELFLKEKGIEVIRIKNKIVENLFFEQSNYWGDVLEQFTNTQL